MTTKVVQPLRITTRTAATMLDLKLDAVRRLIKQGVFTPLVPSGRGRGKRLYLRPEEVQAYAEGGVGAVSAIKKRKR